MEYENPQPKEGINVSHRNHLVDFFTLVAGTIIVIVIITYLMGYLAGFLAKRIPFSYEQNLSKPFENLKNEDKNKKYIYLKALVEKISGCSDLPEEMKIKFHYSNSDIVNAFATLGGNIIVFQGLIDELENENQLAMIIAHEIAHIKNRHPIESLGRGVVVGISLSILLGNQINNPLSKAGLLTILKFGRSMEAQADSDGLIALEKCYGHVNGASGVFEKFEQIQQKENIKQLPFLSTHPLNRKRINTIKNIAQSNYWSETGKLTKLPDFKSDKT